MEFSVGSTVAEHELLGNEIMRTGIECMHLKLNDRVCVRL
jgi:hypothetical protein